LTTCKQQSIKEGHSPKCIRFPRGGYVVDQGAMRLWGLRKRRGFTAIVERLRERLAGSITGEKPGQGLTKKKECASGGKSR